ncbi:hypothetical protein [Tepidibacter thalassicus]|uniref:Uncharacterized protein n=1 Tax=Tepidibacter thalassicus DSM 15285 TaxID=1123350 RepID=A0A1M5NIF4_9FIRM|nr:hypothetical protein [Tepidibacter thalassicus]SHG89235.1 hypothetical protein SAMN02744040_00055 [Tepidibacter thalassicus DSM 15285]
MGRLEKTLEYKKNRRNKRYKILFTLFVFLFLISSISLIDYRTANFMGIYDKPVLIKLYSFIKGLSFKLR